jgi:hypothetical protein
MPLYTFLHNLLNILVQTANKMGFQKASSAEDKNGEDTLGIPNLYSRHSARDNTTVCVADKVRTQPEGHLVILRRACVCSYAVQQAVCFGCRVTIIKSVNT